MRLLYILSLLILLIFCLKLSQLIIKKVVINRWLLLVIMPFIIGIPILIFDEINKFGWIIIYFLITFNSILFFEKSRQLLENKKIKGVIYKSEEGK
ncbi:hypothetical protein HMPREF2994_02915 [Staphylococcus sp. HMSC068H08]|nr:hypothetical protein HMPREF2821_07675 [Staphylococcus sp. HMSC065C10]OFP30477.1 hypothetical protein HMPREF2994_02915 [Staphylococcus sp. HMSC068H08]OFV30521.1 hypothetical protein HMPREF3134_02125 [Staphylococcus sp. HMSC14D10]OHP65216.1 hypothetical protein HMPREF2715_06780 [Staphylococcus sp. HMSC062A01]OHR77081.1 hypothetical protein HMPREF3238_05640 [Staphylococcus sp. HMSC34B12]PYE10134.1 hypothetical protein BDW31_101259 [Staphylococcus sp. AtHG25]